jgi:hypothetical protein
LNLIYGSARRHDATLYALARDEAAEHALCSGIHHKALRGVAAFTLRLKWIRILRFDSLF